VSAKPTMNAVLSSATGLSLLTWFLESGQSLGRKIIPSQFLLVLQSVPRSRCPQIPMEGIQLQAEITVITRTQSSGSARQLTLVTGGCMTLMGGCARWKLTRRPRLCMRINQGPILLLLYCKDIPPGTRELQITRFVRLHLCRPLRHLSLNSRTACVTMWGQDHPAIPFLFKLMLTTDSVWYSGIGTISSIARPRSP
jgi:hypothetical protein